MLKNRYNVIGVMSGTSLDGLDLVHVTFNCSDNWNFKIHHSVTIEYPSYWKKKLNCLVDFSKEELINLDIEYTKLLALEVNKFLKKNSIKHVNAICSHGHTALHKPDEGLTYQIGNRKELAEITNTLVVCDFRVQDVSLGGQGAPLVPIGDQLLFSEYDFCLNLGGFANISLAKETTRIAYDICPVNIVLNHYVRKIGLEYDDQGAISKKGLLDEELLAELNSLEYYKKNHPKSLGLEWVIKTIIPMIDKLNLSTETVLRTFVEHVAIQITNELNKFKNVSVLITGGGVYNTFLIDRIKSLTNNKIIIPNKDIIEYKEALIFGFLGVLSLRGEVNCLQSVTGAKKDHSSGILFHP